LNSGITEQEAIRQYLLGQLPVEDASRLEERLLTEEAFYEELGIVEDELIDQYVGGDLSASDRELFERYFLLADEHQRNVRFARHLRKYVSGERATQPLESDAAEDLSGVAPQDRRRTAKKRPFFSFVPFENPIVSYALVAALVLIVFGSTWIVVKNRRSPGPQTPRNFLTVVLSPGLTREGAGDFKRIVVPTTTDALRLELLLIADDYQKYTATLKNADGKIILTQDLKSESVDGRRVVVLNAPSSSMVPGDYKVELSGHTPSRDTEKVASYSFRVLPR
jgi:anti-sigma-K factor RskA